jgi:FkbM family methyltransferase
MEYSLVFIGAHDGSKQKALIESAALIGEVLLVEPVPELFDRLSNLYSKNPKIKILKLAISEEDSDQTSFYAQTSLANQIEGYGDQLGSLNPSHAKDHNRLFISTTKEIKVSTITFKSLLKKYDITYIDTLVTDTEGYDARILSSFPFLIFRPRQIIFEYKHSDGFLSIGKRLATLLVILENFGYRTKVLDIENCLAIRSE